VPAVVLVKVFKLCWRGACPAHNKIKMSSQSFSFDHHVKVLRGLEEEMAAALKNSSLEVLTQDLQKKKAVSQEALVDVESLDEELLSPGVLSRYLIQLLTRAIATGGEKAWASTMDSLSSLDKAIAEKCLALLEGLKPSTPLPKVAGFLEEEDVPLLTSFVVEQELDWAGLCADLKLPISAEMEENTKNGFTSKKISQALGEWVAGSHTAALPASFQNFRLVLDSESREMSEALQMLEKKVAERREKIVGQSPDTQVCQNKSIILEVQLASSYQSDVFQWQRNGHPVDKGEGYDGTTCPLLFVRVSDKTEGEYSCLVQRGKQKARSRKILLTVTNTHGPVSQLDEVLVKLYSDLEKQQAGRWPSMSTCSFCNLVQVENYSEESLSKRSKVEYNEAFGEIPDGTLVIIKGKSGTGKSLLTYKLTTDWSKGKLLKGIDQVFLLTTNMLSSSSKLHHLSDILKLFFTDQTKQNVCLGEIERAFGRNVCFILDGLDKEQLENENASLILKILHKTYLPESLVIATSSNMAAESSLQTRSLKLLELEKFTDSEQMFQFVYSFPFSAPNSDFEEDSTDDATELVEYIYSRRTVLDICSLPVHVAMACLVQEYNDALRFSTLTELYRQFSQTVDFGKFHRNSCVELNNKGGRDHIFQQICKIAFDATSKGCRFFSEKDSEVSFSKMCGPSSSIVNLVYRDSLSELLGLEEKFSFLCQTLQEFLTAFHIAELSPADRAEAIEMLALKEGTETIWCFLFGLSQDDNALVSLAEVLLPRTGLFGIHCAFESQQVSLCERAVQDGILDLSHKILTPYDLNALRFVTSSSSKPIKKMSFVHCQLGNRTLIEVLSLIPNEKWQLVEDLNLSCNDIGSLGATALADRLKHMFQCNTASSDSPESNFLSLRELDLSHNNLGSDGTITLIHELRASLPQLCLLNLSHNTIGSGGAAVATRDMAKLLSLREVNLSHNNISSDMAVQVVRNFLQVQHKIQVLHLEGGDVVGGDIAQEMLEYKNNLEVYLGPSTIIQSTLHSYQTCCVLS